MFEAQFPALFTPTQWFGNTDVQFTLLSEPPENTLIANINIIPRIEDKWLILRTEAGTWEIPGGTREPNESLLETLQRELLEEAGAKISNKIIPIGAWKCYCHAGKPYRPHTPHPVYYRYVVTAEVEIIGKPTNPQDGEQMISVEALTLSTVMHNFIQDDRQDIAALFQIAKQHYL